MNVYELPAGSTSLHDLRPAERPDPEPGPSQVLVRLRAAALNYRDLSIARGEYMGGVLERDLIPLSDGAGEVEAVGDGVTRFEPGDRVAGTFFQPAEGGPLGQPLDGVLAEYRVFDEDGLVHVPAHLSDDEAATLPCAGVTAWHALAEAGEAVRSGQTVLTLGTGGVSIFAVQFARMMGARVVVTSSSDEKIERARELGAAVAINYAKTPEWHEEVLEKTGGRGADAIVEVGGVGTLGRSFQAVADGGKIALIGVLAEADENPSPYPLMGKNASLHGIFVGDRSMFEAMNAAIEANELTPVVDRVFAFEDAVQAYEYVHEGAHFGKVVIRI